MTNSTIAYKLNYFPANPVNFPKTLPTSSQTQ